MDNENELKDVIEDLNSRYIEITDFLKESENWVFNDEQKLITTQWLSLLKFYSAEFEDLNDEYECLNQQRKNQTYTNKLKVCACKYLIKLHISIIFTNYK